MRPCIIFLCCVVVGELSTSSRVGLQLLTCTWFCLLYLALLHDEMCPVRIDLAVLVYGPQFTVYRIKHLYTIAMRICCRCTDPNSFISLSVRFSFLLSTSTMRLSRSPSMLLALSFYAACAPSVLHMCARTAASLTLLICHHLAVTRNSDLHRARLDRPGGLPRNCLLRSFHLHGRRLRSEYLGQCVVVLVGCMLDCALVLTEQSVLLKGQGQNPGFGPGKPT